MNSWWTEPRDAARRGPESEKSDDNPKKNEQITLAGTVFPALHAWDGVGRHRILVLAFAVRFHREDRDAVGFVRFRRKPR